MKLKKHIAVVAAAVMMIVVCLSLFIVKAQAAYDTWDALKYLEMRKNVESAEGQHSLKDDITTYSGNYTNDVGKIYADEWHFFDNIKLQSTSRLTYGRKIRVDAGQQLNIVAAKEDTADAGGECSNAGLKFYWSMAEYDEYGNIVFDGGWRSSSDTWIVGFTENGDTGYGKDGYPYGENAATRQSKVRYVVPIFRWNNGDQGIGSGSVPIYADNITQAFQVFSLVTAPFTYTFNLNGGNINGSTEDYKMQRLGTSTVGIPATPQRDGYVFTGWKITSQGGKQKDKVYDAGQLVEMFSDGKYWSSLFEDATFEAQWANADQFVNYMRNGADNKSDYYKSYAASYSENKYDAISFTKTGYTAESNWEARDKMNNYWFSTAGDGTSKMLQLSGATTIRSKLNIDCTIDVNEGSFSNGANVQTWGCLYNAAQMFSFQFVKLENGVPYWTIRNTYSGKVLDLALNTGANGGNDGANVQMYTYHGGDNQLWTLEMAGDGYFYIRSKLDNNLVLDLWGNEAGYGKNIAVSGFHGGDNQKWMLCDNSINLYANWTNNNYKVSYDADGGTLYDDSGNETTQNVKTYEYDKTYSFYTAKRAYTVSYETNGGTASIGTANTDAAATFNGWNENLNKDTSHGILNGSADYTTGTWNWAAYYNGNHDLLDVTGNVYDTMLAIFHYRTYGISEKRQFSGSSYWLPSLKFRNLTANGGTVYVKANYSNGSVILPKPEKETVQENGMNKSYVFSGWYKDSTLTEYAGAAGDSYTPDSDITLYAKYTETDGGPVSCSVTIEHYKMNDSGKYPYMPSESETVEKNYGTVLKLSSLAKSYEGYTFDADKAKSVNGSDSVTVKGKTTIKLYYSRNKYTVTITHYYMDTAGNYPEEPAGTETRQVYYGNILVHSNLKVEIKGLSYNEKKSAQENGGRTQTEVTGEAVIKLYYDRKTCTVTYDYKTNGGTSVEKETVQTYYGAEADLSVKAHKDGFEHTGWNTDAEARTGFAQYTVTGNVTLYAVYRKDITVTFVDFAGTEEKNISLYNTQEYALIDAPEITPYAQWENVSEIKTVGYNRKKDILADGAQECEVKSGQKELKVSESATYYAVCSTDVTLSYVLNGGTENDTTKPVTKTVYCNAADPQEVKGFALQLGESIRESYDEDGYTHSYTFAVWAENSEDSQMRYACNADYVLKQSTVMYAVWNETVTPITYYVGFDGNAGTAARNVPDPVEATYGMEVTLPAVKPERTGFTFVSWNTRADGQGTDYQPEDVVKNLTTVNGSTVKLYAQWKQRKLVLVKAASTMYNDTIIKRTEGDDAWYDAVGHLTINELKNYPDEQCVQVWHIDKEGTITQMK